MGQNNKLMSLLVNILLSSSYIINIWGYCSPLPLPPLPIMKCVCVMYYCVRHYCIVQFSSSLRLSLKRWHLDLNLMNKWWCHAHPFREVVKCLVESCEVWRHDGDTRARGEVEGGQGQEDGGRSRRSRRRRLQQTFLLQSQRVWPRQKSQPESDPGEQR